MIRTRVALYLLVFLYVLPLALSAGLLVVMLFRGRTGAALILLPVVLAYVVITPLRLRGRVSYFKPAPITELRRRLHR